MLLADADVCAQYVSVTQASLQRSSNLPSNGPNFDADSADSYGHYVT